MLNGAPDVDVRVFAGLDHQVLVGPEVPSGVEIFLLNGRIRPTVLVGVQFDIQTPALDEARYVDHARPISVCVKAHLVARKF